MKLAGISVLPIVVGDGFAEKFAAIRAAQRFKRIGIESVSANSREDRVEQTLGQDARSANGGLQRLLIYDASH